MTALHADAERIGALPGTRERGKPMFRPLGNGFLRDKAGEGEAGGGDDKTPKPLTEEDVGNIANSAVTAHLKKAIPRAVSDAIAALKLDEQIGTAIAKLAPPAKPAGSEEGGSDDGSGRVTTKALQQQLTTLQEKLDASEKKSVELERQRIEIEQRSRFDAAKGSFRSAIQPKVRPELLDVLVDNVATVQQKLKVDDAGQTTLTVKRAPYKGAPPVDEDLPLAEAIPLWLATDDVKPFLPAPGGHQEDKKKQPGYQLQAGANADKDPASAAMAALEAAGIDPSAL